MIELAHINRSFRVGDETVHGLDDVSLSARQGEYLAIMGASGSGKSTLLNVIGLLDRPDSGSYRFADVAVSDLDPQQQARFRRENIGFVFQAFHLVPRLSAADNIALPLVLDGVDPDERETRVDEVMRVLDISHRAHHRPDQLSGGQRQRVAIARAVVARPLVLLADEPTGNLDHQSGLDVIAILEELNQQGITLLLVTHDAELGRRARRTVHMLDGRVLPHESE